MSVTGSFITFTHVPVDVDVGVVRMYTYGVDTIMSKTLRTVHVLENDISGVGVGRVGEGQGGLYLKKESIP